MLGKVIFWCELIYDRVRKDGNIKYRIVFLEWGRGGDGMVVSSKILIIDVGWM